MSYKVDRRLGYQPWGVVNPWVFADYGQPQRHRGYVSPIIFQTEPPVLSNHHLGYLGQATTPSGTVVSDAEARGARMETLAKVGLGLSALSLAVYLYTVSKVTGSAAPMHMNRRRRVRRNTGDSFLSLQRIARRQGLYLDRYNPGDHTTYKVSSKHADYFAMGSSDTLLRTKKLAKVRAFLGHFRGPAT